MARLMFDSRGVTYATKESIEERWRKDVRWT